MSLNELLRTRTLPMVVIPMVALALGGCLGGEMSPLSPGAAGGTSNPDRLLADSREGAGPDRMDKTSLIGFAKLRPAEGFKMAGEIELYADGDAVIVVGAATGLTPSATYVSFLHGQSGSNGAGCFTDLTAPLDVGVWMVDRAGRGVLKTTLKKSALDPVEQFVAVSLQRLENLGGPSTRVDACGTLVFPR